MSHRPALAHPSGKDGTAHCSERVCNGNKGCGHPTMGHLNVGWAPALIQAQPGHRGHTAPHWASPSSSTVVPGQGKPPLKGWHLNKSRVGINFGDILAAAGPPSGCLLCCMLAKELRSKSIRKITCALRRATLSSSITESQKGVGGKGP